MSLSASASPRSMDILEAEFARFSERRGPERVRKFINRVIRRITPDTEILVKNSLRDLGYPQLATDEGLKLLAERY